MNVREQIIKQLLNLIDALENENTALKAQIAELTKAEVTQAQPTPAA